MTPTNMTPTNNTPTRNPHHSTRRSRLRHRVAGRVVSGLVVAAMVLPVFASPVFAQASSTTTTIPEESPSTTVDSQTPATGGIQIGDLADRYQSLSAALFAERPDLSAGFAAYGEGFGLPDKASLLDGGYAFKVDSSGFSNLWEYASNFHAKGGLDGKIATAASMYAASLGSLKTPELNVSNFQAPELKIPEEALMFGLVFNQSLTGMLSDSNVLSQIQSSGIDSPTTRDLWNKSMADATSRVEANLGDKLISPCYGAFLAGMGGGVDALSTYKFSEKCSSCAAGGLYMNHEMNRLLDQTYDATYYDRDDDVLVPAEYVEIPSWIRTMMEDQDPVRLPQMNAASRMGPPTENIGPTLTECNASAQAATPALQDMVSGVTNHLRQTGGNQPR